MTKLFLKSTVILLGLSLFSGRGYAKMEQNKESAITPATPKSLPPLTSIQKPKGPILSTKKEKLVKDGKGNMVVTWKLFQDFDLSTKKAGVNLQQIIGQNISITGFIIPLDYSAKKIKEFLLVPYVPSCMHVPPPPDNMVISVTVPDKEGIVPSYYPVDVTGKLELAAPRKEKNLDLPDNIFSMISTSIKEVKN